MGEHLVLWVQILAPKPLPGLRRGRGVPPCPCHPAGTCRGAKCRSSPQLSPAAARLFLFVFLPLRAILSLPYAVIIITDNLAAALLFRAQQSHAPPPSLPPSAPGQRLGSSNRNSCSFCHSGGSGPFSPPSPSVSRRPTPASPKGMDLEIHLLPWRKLSQWRDALGEGQQRGGEGDFLVYFFYYHVSSITCGICCR